MKNKQTIESDLMLLLEDAFNLIQKGHSVLPAVYETIDHLSGQISDELVDVFNQIRSRLSMGDDFIQILSDSHFFQNDSHKLEKDLLEQSYKNPTQIKKIWLDWMNNTKSFKFEDSSVFQFLNEFLGKNGSLWIATEEASALNNILQALGENGRRSNCQTHPNDNFESLQLRCKRDHLKPNAQQLVLWVDRDSKGSSTITALDEISGRDSGRADFNFNRIFLLKRNGRLCPTGYIPTCYETLNLGPAIDVGIFSET